ncbi:hypothetical protein GCM10018783_31560 [Streptomyces griseosporeus]|nr:hypothetical protein GCM10018783_31560 [Streptomyces griseosporeus]
MYAGDRPVRREGVPGVGRQTGLCGHALGQPPQVGDVLRVSCPFTEARVVRVTRDEISVEWPWGRIDPRSALRWNGRRAIPRATPPGTWGGLFQVAPGDEPLRPGGVCRVGIPETLVRVVDTGHYDPPLDVGWLPRPHTLLIVAPAESTWTDEDDETDTIEVESAAPLVIERGPSTGR